MKQASKEPKANDGTLLSSLEVGVALGIGVALSVLLFFAVRQIPASVPAGVAYVNWFSWTCLGGGLLLTGWVVHYLYNSARQIARLARELSHLQMRLRATNNPLSASPSHDQACADYLATMSHEIRTPLNALLGYAQILQRDRSLDPEQTDAINAIITSGNHLLGLINNILALSKMEAGSVEIHRANFDLNETLRQLELMFKPRCAQKKLTFKAQLLPVPRQVNGDEALLRQVLINLLSNAVKFTQSGEIFLGVKPDGQDRYQFEVIDTGIGIPLEEQAAVFTPYYQGPNSSDKDGTGLGLVIAKKQVALMGGELNFESGSGYGCRFYFTLPLPTAKETFAVSDDESELPPLDFATLMLPEELSAQLLIAAELHSTTVLKSHLDAVRQQGPQGALLAQHLRHHIRTFDMTSIQKILSQIRTIPSQAPPLSPSHHLSHTAVSPAPKPNT